MPMHEDFKRILQNMRDHYGEERGTSVFYAWLNKHDYDDTKPAAPQIPGGRRITLRKKTGWRKTQDATTRRKKLYASTDKRKNRHERYLQAARRAQALANITKDPETKKKARLDAQYFYRRARKTR